MDVLPFKYKNGLWFLDKPELMETHLFYAPLFMAERGISEFLDELAGNIFDYLTLEFSYTRINPYDAKLVKAGATYKCVSIFGNSKDYAIWLPPPIFKAMTTNSNPESIYIKVVASVSTKA